VTSTSAGTPVEPESNGPLDVVDDLAHRVEEALRIGAHRFSPQVAARAGAALERARQRLLLGSEVTVVAFAGATGSGKSSLFNALAQMDISEVAARRPTTSDPQACVWGLDIADPLLDWLGVLPRNRTRRESVLDADREAGLAGLVLLDLPDHDSAELSHHLAVDRLVDLVDLLIWVVDPQKYADDSVHSGYLRSLAGRQDTMLIVLNQVDRLDANAVAACRHDLHRLLDADGLESVRVLATSVSRGDGIAELRGQVIQTIDGRRRATERARTDLDGALRMLRSDLGDHRPEPIHPQVSEDLVRSLGDASGMRVLLGAVAADYRRQAEHRLGCPFRRWWWRFRPDPLLGSDLKDAGEALRSVAGGTLPAPSSSQRSRVEIALRDVVDDLGKGVPARWAEDIRVIARAGAEDLPEALDSALGGVDLSIVHPRWWRVVGVLESMVALATIAGFVWLGWHLVDLMLLGGGGAGPLPVALGLAVGGLALGGVLATSTLTLVAVSARRRRDVFEARFVELISEVVSDRLLTPVDALLDDFRQVREVVHVPD
jgi:GTP-binding protein EngB required for normal cell division